MVAARNPGGALAIFFCVLGGIALGIILAFPAIVLVAMPTGGNTCNGTYLSIALGVAVTLAIAGAFVYGIRVATRRPQIATLLMSGAVAFMFPFAPCFLSVFSSLQSCHH